MNILAIAVGFCLDLILADHSSPCGGGGTSLPLSKIPQEQSTNDKREAVPATKIRLFILITPGNGF